MSEFTPEEVEALRLSLACEPRIVESATVLALISGYQRLMGDVLTLSAKLDAPCGSCHPCTNYADETWRAAGRTPPHVYQWDETRTEVDRLRRGMRDLHAQWTQRAIDNGDYYNRTAAQYEHGKAVAFDAAAEEIRSLIGEEPAEAAAEAAQAEKGGTDA